MSEALIKTSYNPAIENPDLAKEIQADNDIFQKEQDSATPERTKKMNNSFMEGIYGVKSDKPDIFASLNKLQNQTQEELMNFTSEKDSSIPIEYNNDGSIVSYNDIIKSEGIDDLVEGGTDFGAPGIPESEIPNIEPIEENIESDQFNNESSNSVHLEKQTISRESVTAGIEHNTGFTPEEITKKITETPEREKNKKQAENLFYKEGMVNSLISESSNGDAEKLKENKEFFNNEDVQEDLEKIMGNFVTDNKGESLTEVFENGGKEQSIKINESLNLAFEMQVNVILDGKINYDSEKVDKLLIDLQEGNPFDKLVAFEDIKNHVNTSEGSKGKKLTDLNKKGKESADKSKLTIQDKFDNAKYMIDMGKKHNDINMLQEAEMDLLAIKEETTKGEVFEGGDIDILLNEVQEELKEQA